MQNVPLQSKQFNERHCHKETDILSMVVKLSDLLTDSDNDSYISDDDERDIQVYS